MNILIIGADGMIGHGLWQYFSSHSSHKTVGSIRTRRDYFRFPANDVERIFVSGDLDTDNSIRVIFENAQPGVVINCAGITKHLTAGGDALACIPANSLLPHRIAKIAEEYSARVIHISTDCVFSGTKGAYNEQDLADSDDVYGRSKVLGEVTNKSHVLTIRTSTIGYELNSKRGLLEWFLSQDKSCRGFTNAYFSGLTMHGLAKIIDKYILPNPKLTGLLHVAGPRISKHELISKIALKFEKKIEIIQDGSFCIDRSLDASKFAELTGYEMQDWDTMLTELKEQGRGV